MAHKGVILQAAIIALSILVAGYGVAGMPPTEQGKFSLPSGLVKQRLNPKMETLVGFWTVGDCKEAIKEAAKLISSKSLNAADLAYAFCIRGNSHAMEGDNAAAIEAFDQGLLLNPNIEGSAQIYSIRASCFTAIGDKQTAIESLTKSISIEPNGAAYLKRAALYSAVDQIQLARKDIEAASQFPESTSEAKKLSDLLN